MIRQKVQKIRHRQHRVGTRKLKDHLADQGVIVGRDRLFELLRHWQMLVKPKRRYHQTTYSRHRLKTYPNLVRDHQPTGPDQVYASDITYLATDRGYQYLFLTTDMYSRKIVGHCLNKDLTMTGSLSALQKVLKQRRSNTQFIHHSDRGLQYCAHDYVRLLEKHNGSVSMTEQNHVYENALAERVNGILKTELLPDNLPEHLAGRIVEQAIDIYNKERLHNSLGNRTPDSVHRP